MSIRSAEGLSRAGSMQTRSIKDMQRLSQLQQQRNQGDKKKMAKDSVVISIDELERIKGQCSMVKDEYHQYTQSVRQDLQTISNARVKNWPNTLQALRAKKEQDRIKRLEDEEIKRREVDAEEESYQQTLRMKELQRANKIMHDNQDMVKAFKSKMLMCDVAKEQEHQMAVRQHKQRIMNDIEKQWEEVEKQKMKDYDDKLKAKLEAEYIKKMKNTKDVSDQLEEYKNNFIKNLKEQMLEGELIKRQCDEENEREKLRALDRLKKTQQVREDFNYANQELIKFQETQKIKEVQDEKRQEEFAKKKDALDTMKKEKEDQRFKEKLEIRQKMIDRQIEELMKVRNKEEEILNHQVQEAEEKASKIFEEQEKRKAEMKAAIERSRAAQIERKKKQKNDDSKANKEYAEFWRLRNEELQIAEQQEREEERQRQVELKQFQAMQNMERNKKNLEEELQHHQSTAESQALLDQQEKNFYSYAEQCIKDWQQDGKNVKPLIMELKNYKKRIQ